MGKIKKYKNRLEKFLATERGKRLINFAYSFGAAIVILGAMFKLLHFPFGNEMLFIGMMTECVVFIVSAFDTPIRDYDWEQVFPVLATNDPDDRPGFNKGVDQPVVINAASGHSFSSTQSQHESGSKRSVEVPIQTEKIHSVRSDSGDYVEQLSSVSDNVRKFAEATETLTKISESLLTSYQYITDNSQNIGQNSVGYVRQMEALNKNIAGLNTIYEIQLKSISGQIDTIEHINHGLNRIKYMFDGSVPDSAVFKQETEKMTLQLKELNQIYARLIQAMTMNTGNNPNTPNV